MIFLNEWLVMLLIGNAHHIDNRIPALGYWLVITLSVAYRILRWRLIADTAAATAVNKQKETKKS